MWRDIIMVPYDKVILNKLLDSYESSLLSTGKNERTIHIEWRFTKKNLPVYFDESSEEYEKIHILMQGLEDNKLIKIIWKDKKQGHIISKVQLSIENLDNAYGYVKRVPKTDLVSENRKMLAELLQSTDSLVVRKFIHYLLERFHENKSVKEFIELESLKESRKLITTIQAIEKNQEALYLREFSIRTFQDSKEFEQIISKVFHVFQRFDERCHDMEIGEWLSEHNIYQTPNYVYLKGKVCIRMEDKEIDLALFKQGLGISGEDIEKIEIVQNNEVNRILTIENLTTFFRWQENNSLIVYLGGYHNTTRRNLLNKIYQTYPKAEYYHFGDIDAGGFEIYYNLCERTKIPFQMYHMDLDTLQKYENYGKKLTENDKKRLQGMRSREEIQGLLEYMLERNVKLEQECIDSVLAKSDEEQSGNM